MILYRPVGLKELELIAEADFKAFPPRLAHQPIFYPVLNFDYAEQIARDWNTKEGTQAGFVTRFDVDDVFAEKYEVHRVGGKIHDELWVPAEDLEEFNHHIIGRIEVVASYYGPGFSDDTVGTPPVPTNIASRMGEK
jgi:hypothetical protein